MYKIGDKVVYPHHGAGTIVKKESREVLGTKREYLTIKILHNDMTVQVPSENADEVGLRRVIGEKEVAVVLKALTGGSTEMPKNWNRRFKHNRDKMKTGDVLELAEVVRNLSLRDHEKGLSTGEKQMFVKAKKILASELMYAKTMDEDECAEWLEEVLVHRRQRQEESDGFEEEGRRRDRVTAGCRSGRSSSPRGAARGSAWNTEGVREARRGSTPRRASAPPRRLRLDRRDRRRRASGVGGARDLARRGARLRQGVACVAGGATRADSVRAGLAEVPADALVVLVHDAARPLITDEVIERVLAPLSEGWDGVVPGLPVSDTLKRVGTDGAVEETVSRDSLYAVQTPQAFVADVFRRAAAGDAEATDCAGLVEAAGGRVKVVEGDPRLLKVTTADDLAKIASWLAT